MILRLINHKTNDMTKIAELIHKNLSTELIPSRQLVNISIMMQEYAKEIVEECRLSFRWEYDCQDEHDAVIIVDIDSVEDVLKQIK